MEKCRVQFSEHPPHPTPPFHVWGSLQCPWGVMLSSVTTSTKNMSGNEVTLDIHSMATYIYIYYILPEQLQHFQTIFSHLCHHCLSLLTTICDWSSCCLYQSHVPSFSTTYCRSFQFQKNEGEQSFLHVAWYINIPVSCDTFTVNSSISVCHIFPFIDF